MKPAATATALRVLVVLATLTVLGLLWQLRPGLPTVPSSWTAPMSTLTVEEAFFWIVYLLLAGCLLLLAYTLTDEIACGIRERREQRLQAFAARVLPKPPPAAAPRAPRWLPAKPIAMIPTPVAIPAHGSELPATSRGALETAGSQTANGKAAALTGQALPSISILGPPRISGAKPRRGRLRAATQQLIVYLALHPDGAATEQLTEAIWPGKDPQRTRARLWQSATDARAVIGDTLTRDDERYKLDRTRLAIDLDQLQTLTSHAKKTEDAEVEYELLEQALALYRGQPLAGCDYPWADAHIRDLSARCADLLLRAGHARLTRGEPHAALQAAEQGLQLDQFNETLWRLALEAEHALGLRESVTRRYRQLTRTLDEQLGLQPSQETRHLYRRLLGQA